MAKIHVNRSGETLGQFTSAEVLEGLRLGRFKPTDLAWMSGEPEWRPLSEFASKLQAEISNTTRSDAPPLPEGIDLSPAWERRSQIGLIAAILETIQEVLMQPGPTFTRMKTGGGLGSPLLYYMILGCIGTGIGAVYQLAFSALDPSGFEDLPIEVGTPIFFIVGLVSLVFLVPLFVFIGAFIGAGFTHLMLMLVGGAKKEFETTFRVLCYAYGTCSLLQIIPICGSFIYAIYSIVVTAIGLAKAHEIETWRAALAILLPVILCCGLLIGLVILGAGAAILPSLQ